MRKKIYVLTVSQYFPATHTRAGDETEFIKKILAGTKIHTIRGNYDFWAKRAEKINKGEAVLQVRVWKGKPYRSPQQPVFEFKKIGIEKIKKDFLLGWHVINDKKGIISVDEFEIAYHDGLIVEDFNSWFPKDDYTDPMAIIHFTKDFRYGLDAGEKEGD